MATNLNIEIVSPQEETIWGLRSYRGKIIIGDFEETIYVPVEFWSLADYQKQWAEGLERIKNETKSCLVAAIQGHNGIPTLINWWAMYKKDNKIFIQNQLLIEKSLEKTLHKSSFTVENCYDHIPRKSISKKVSEWVVDIEKT